jgi:hypothetical protein
MPCCCPDLAAASLWRSRRCAGNWIFWSGWDDKGQHRAKVSMANEIPAALSSPASERETVHGPQTHSISGGHAATSGGHAATDGVRLHLAGWAAPAAAWTSACDWQRLSPTGTVLPRRRRNGATLGAGLTKNSASVASADEYPPPAPADGGSTWGAPRCQQAGRELRHPSPGRAGRSLWPAGAGDLLDSRVIMALLGATTVQAGAIAAIIARSLFPSRSVGG